MGSSDQGPSIVVENNVRVPVLSSISMKSERWRSNKLRSIELKLLFVASPTTVRRGARAGSVRTYAQLKWIRIPAEPTRKKVLPMRLCVLLPFSIHARYPRAKSNDRKNLQLITKIAGLQFDKLYCHQIAPRMLRITRSGRLVDNTPSTQFCTKMCKVRVGGNADRTAKRTQPAGSKSLALIIQFCCLLRHRDSTPSYASNPLWTTQGTRTNH